MFALKVAKLVVFSLSILLIVMGSLVFLKLTDNHGKINQKNNILKSIDKKVSIFLNKDEKISNIFSCQEYICVVIGYNEQNNKILIINPLLGEVIRTITFQRDKI